MRCSARADYRLDPVLAPLLAELARRPSVESLSLSEARKAVHELCAFQGRPPKLGQVVELRVPTRHGGVRARLYAHSPDGPSAAVVFFHGGGWQLGDLDFADTAVRTLARLSGVVWVSAEYPLAPEYRYPCAVESAMDVLTWIERQGHTLGIDPLRVAVAGESSGANIAASSCVALRDAGLALPRHQFLVMPPLDVDFDTASYREFQSGYFLERAAMREYWAAYLGSLVDDPPADAAPLRLRDARGLPAATVIVAELDPLRDDGLRYAAKLSAADVKTEIQVWGGMTHGAFQFAGAIPTVKRKFRHFANRIARVLA